MESNTETTARPREKTLGSFEVTLLRDPTGSSHAVTVQPLTVAENIAREVPLVIGSLLFLQQQMRAVNDPSRLGAVEAMAEACRASRENRSVSRGSLTSPRPAATYRVTLVANGGFRITVDEKLAGILADAAGGLTASALARELLATLREPYRTFYREMLEAAVDYWHERRPSLIESTWVWTLALRRLDQFVRQGVASLGTPQTCAVCHAVRPAGFPCLHCGTKPGEGGAARPDTTAGSSVGSAPPVVAHQVAVPAHPSPVEAPVPVQGETSPSVDASQPVTRAPAPVPVASSRPAPAREKEQVPQHTILPAQETAPIELAPASTDERGRWPLASLLPRAIALLIDLVIAFVVSSFGAIGLVTILLAVGALGPATAVAQAASLPTLVLFALYFLLGWTGGETFGMMIFHLQVVQDGSRQRCGFFRALGRGLGYLAILIAGVAVFYVGNQFDNTVLVSIPTGTPADDAIRAIVLLASLYVIWLGTGQRILSDPRRQTVGDKFGGTLVLARPKSV